MLAVPQVAAGVAIEGPPLPPIPLRPFMGCLPAVVVGVVAVAPEAAVVVEVTPVPLAVAETAPMVIPVPQAQLAKGGGHFMLPEHPPARQQVVTDLVAMVAMRAMGRGRRGQHRPPRRAQQLPEAPGTH